MPNFCSLSVSLCILVLFWRSLFFDRMLQVRHLEYAARSRFEENNTYCDQLSNCVGGFGITRRFFRNYVSLLPLVMKTFCVVLDQVGDPNLTSQCKYDNVSSVGHIR